MYKNIGVKIKLLADLCGILFLVVGIGGGLYFLLNDPWTDDRLVWPLLAGGIVGFLSSFPLYGFGELIENVQAIAKRKKETEEAKVEKE